jgi:hypothetical protein
VTDLDRVREVGWPLKAAERAGAQAALERGEVVALPRHGFVVEEDERALLDARVSDGRSKNVSFDPDKSRLAGAAVDGEALAALGRMMGRFSAWAQALVLAIAPGYGEALQLGRTSFRPCAVVGRAQSPRKDDRRLHVDAFPSQPVQGRRILRVFANVDPEGRPRVWNVGEPFEAFAAEFAARTRPAAPGSRWLMRTLGLTKGRRSGYDEMMLQLHDGAKLDEAWQVGAPRQRASFPAGSSWVVFTDAALHAALEGQHALEQTFFLPVEAMERPELSPLKVLERMSGRSLV